MHLPAVARGRDLHAVSLEITGNQFAYTAIVVDNQYVIDFFHDRHKRSSGAFLPLPAE
jgi:hypothetical protein